MPPLARPAPPSIPHAAGQPAADPARASVWPEWPLPRRVLLAGGLALGLGALLGPAAGRAAAVEDALLARLALPTGLTVAPDGGLLVADAYDRCVRRLDPAGRLTTLAGWPGVPGDGGDGGPATSALLRWPTALALAPDGGLYIADADDHRVRRVGPDGRIGAVAGTGERGFGGDGGPATLARLNGPLGLAVAPDGALYIADTGNDRIRRVDQGGRIATVAGGDGVVVDWPEPQVRRFGGDGGPATLALLHRPADVAVAADGGLYVADAYNGRIRRIAPDGIIATVAGGGDPWALGDGGPAAAAWLHLPHGVALRPDGALLIADSLNHRVRLVDGQGAIWTLAGSGTGGFAGDGGPATLADLNGPWRAAVMPDGALAIADRSNHRLRRVDAAGAIRTIAGSGAPDPADQPPPPASGYVTA